MVDNVLQPADHTLIAHGEHILGAVYKVAFGRCRLVIGIALAGFQAAHRCDAVRAGLARKHLLLLCVQHNNSRARKGIALIVHLFDGHGGRDAGIAEAERAGHLASVGNHKGVFILIQQIAWWRLELLIGIGTWRKARNNRIPVVIGGILANDSPGRCFNLDLAAGKARSDVRAQFSDACFTNDRWRRRGKLIVFYHPVFGVCFH